MWFFCLAVDKNWINSLITKWRSYSVSKKDKNSGKRYGVLLHSCLINQKKTTRTLRKLLKVPQLSLKIHCLSSDSFLWKLRRCHNILLYCSKIFVFFSSFSDQKLSNSICYATEAQNRLFLLVFKGNCAHWQLIPDSVRFCRRQIWNAIRKYFLFWHFLLDNSSKKALKRLRWPLYLWNHNSLRSKFNLCRLITDHLTW